VAFLSRRQCGGDSEPVRLIVRESRKVIQAVLSFSALKVVGNYAFVKELSVLCLTILDWVGSLFQRPEGEASVAILNQDNLLNYLFIIAEAVYN
jgi:hypothetical protein